MRKVKHAVRELRDEPVRARRGPDLVLPSKPALRRPADAAPMPPKGAHLQIAVPLDRPPAARPFERRGEELRIGRHVVIKAPFWGCSTVPYVYDLIVGGERVKRFCSPPTEQECADAIRLHTAARHPPTLVEPPKRKRGRPAKP